MSDDVQSLYHKFLTESHVRHALLQENNRFLDLPIVSPRSLFCLRELTGQSLATFLYLNVPANEFLEQHAWLSSLNTPWQVSAAPIASETDKTEHLGDGRQEPLVNLFQRSFLTYFSQEVTRYAGDARGCALVQLFEGEKPLVYGLFPGRTDQFVGTPLVFLSDGIELRSSLLVMDALALSAVGWQETMHEMLSRRSGYFATDLLASPTGPTGAGLRLQTAPTVFCSPEEILKRVAHEARFCGIMKAGPGFHRVAHVFSNFAAGATLVGYLCDVDTSDPARFLEQIAVMSALLLGATHLPEQIAFDLYLSHLPTYVHSVRVVMDRLVQAHEHKVLLVRVLWLVVLLTYVTQLRPVIDGKLLATPELAAEERSWDAMFGEVRRRRPRQTPPDYVAFMRTLRSLRELEAAYGPAHGKVYYHAAWKLAKHWNGWTGLGREHEVTLNVRL